MISKTPGRAQEDAYELDNNIIIKEEVAAYSFSSTRNDNDNYEDVPSQEKPKANNLVNSERFLTIQEHKQ